MNDLNPEKIAKDLRKIVTKLEELKKITESKKIENFLDCIAKKHYKNLYHN